MTLLSNQSIWVLSIARRCTAVVLGPVSPYVCIFSFRLQGKHNPLARQRYVKYSHPGPIPYATRQTQGKLTRVTFFNPTLNRSLLLIYSLESKVLNQPWRQFSSQRKSTNSFSTCLNNFICHGHFRKSRAHSTALVVWTACAEWGPIRKTDQRSKHPSLLHIFPPARRDVLQLEFGQMY